MLKFIHFLEIEIFWIVYIFHLLSTIQVENSPNRLFGKREWVF